jgi:hypothetical protein
MARQRSKYRSKAGIFAEKHGMMREDATILLELYETASQSRGYVP